MLSLAIDESSFLAIELGNVTNIGLYKMAYFKREAVLNHTFIDKILSY